MVLFKILFIRELLKLVIKSLFAAVKFITLSELVFERVSLLVKRRHGPVGFAQYNES